MPALSLVRGIALSVAKEQRIRGIQVDNAAIGRKRANALVRGPGQKCDKSHEVLGDFNQRIIPPRIEFIEDTAVSQTLLRLSLFRRKVAARLLRLKLLRRVLLLAKAALLSEATLLAETVLLLPKAVLLLAVHLAGGSANLRSADGGGLIRPAEQHIPLVHHRVVDELPLVVGFLLVVNANRLFFAQAGDTNNGPTAKLRVAASRVLSEGRITGLAEPPG